MINDTRPANVQHVKGLHAAVPRTGTSPLRFEAYGPGGSALLVDCVTGDPERMRAQLRRMLRDHGGYLGANGSVGYLFDHVGLLRYLPKNDPERLIQAALSAGAEDAIGTSSAIEVLTDPEELEVIRAGLQRQGFAPLTAETTKRAAVAVALSGDEARRMLRLLEALTALDDVRDVYTNAELVGPPGT